MHCTRNFLFPYEYEWTCISCGYNVEKQKSELGRISREKINFINRLENAQHKIFCNCIDVCKIYESHDFIEIFDNLTRLNYKKEKIKEELFGKDENMDKDFD